MQPVPRPLRKMASAEARREEGAYPTRCKPSRSLDLLSLLQVNVSVNGNPIPFSMKIGDAGEAFFVFETEDDVPEDLITSPILQATTAETEAAVATGAKESEKDKKFGANDETADNRTNEEKKRDEKNEEERILKKHEEPLESPMQEPEYLDLDGRPQSQTRYEESAKTPRPNHHTPQFLSPGGGYGQGRSHLDELREVDDDHVSGNRTPEMLAQDQRVDQALAALKANAHVPEVEYHHGSFSNSYQ